MTNTIDTKDLGLLAATGTAIVLGYKALQYRRRAYRALNTANKMVEITTMFGNANLEFADALDSQTTDPMEAFEDWKMKMEFITLTMDI